MPISSIVFLVMLSIMILVNAATTIGYILRGVSFKEQSKLTSMRVGYIGTALFTLFVIVVVGMEWMVGW